MNQEKIPVTRPFLPPRAEYDALINEVWENDWLTNMGPLANRLEHELSSFLGVESLLFVTNGTIALQMAIKALELEGEIITTPFTFVATTASIVWEGCQPVFVDIQRDSLNIDPQKIEAAITDKTTAILATHVYGNPCDVAAIDAIAQKHHLKVIYDAAHAFGVQINGKSIFEFGDVSTCSLHATKLYHSIEGGLIMTKHKDLLKKLAYIRNFGISGHDSFAELGINGKNSEFHAAMGLANLKHIQAIMKKRRELTALYDEKLADLKAFRPKWHENSENNGAYYPIVLESEKQLLKVVEHLAQQGIGTRRYFYPSLASSLPYLAPKELPITEAISKKVLCLPMYYDLKFEEIEKIAGLILNWQNK